VRFLVQETLAPQLAERSPKEDPHPGRIVELKVLDPAMGSGHFLVEACRYLGEALYEACRLCDELAVQAEKKAGKTGAAGRETLVAHAAELRKRVEDLPDPEDELVAYLPSRAAEGEEGGLSQRKAEALCRRLVAVHCLYGVDKNPLAVELAKLSLWLESYAEGLPLTFMDHRLICGDSLTGPFLEHLLTYPGSGGRLDDLFAQSLTERLQGTLAAALDRVRDLETSVGKDVADLEQKRSAKEKLDAALAPLKTLAAAWSGGVMLGNGCDDAGYQALAEAVGKEEDTAGVVDTRPQLRNMVEVGRNGVAFQLAFPEVFLANDGAQCGFDAVLGNPPWDAIKFNTREFLASFDFMVLGGTTKAERTGAERRVLENASKAEAFHRYREGFEWQKRTNDRLFEYQKLIIEGDLAGRQLDQFRVFIERGYQLTDPNKGFLGQVVPGGYHINAGAVGARKICLTKMQPVCCFSFVNRRKLFEIALGQRIDVFVSRSSRDDYYASLTVAFSLEDPAWLFGYMPPDRLLDYSLDFIKETSGPYLSLIEANSNSEFLSCKQVYRSTARFSTLATSHGVRFSRQPHALDMSADSDAFVDTTQVFRGDPRLLPLGDTANRGLLVLHEKGTFDQYTDIAKDYPRYCVDLHTLQGHQEALASARYYRAVTRDTIHEGEEHKVVGALLPPGSLVGNTANIEANAPRRPNSSGLTALAVLNSHLTDFIGHRVVLLHLNLFILARLPFPDLLPAGRLFLAHSALRLTCNHAGYAPLWTEQLGDTWREPTPTHTWPVLAGDDARWAVRAAIDAVVADAYGLDRAQYEHVLSTFSHRSYPKAPEPCLAAFDELKAIGLDAFTKKHDPYWDIPLNEDLPKPVIDLPVPRADEAAESGLGPLFAGSARESAEPPPEAEAPRDTTPTAPEPGWIARKPIDRQVLILARIVAAHQSASRLHALGNVKAEKIVYLVEAHAGIDLERKPIREAAGPADFPRLKKAIHRGAKLRAFSVQGGSRGHGGVWSPEAGLHKRLGEYEALFAAERADVDRIIDLLVPMDSEQAEIIATLYACWNDLLARRAQCDDATIIEDFRGWAEGKGRFDAARLASALAWMRQHDLVPTGRATQTAPRRTKKPGKARLPHTQPEAQSDSYEIIARLLAARGVISSSDAQRATGLDATGVRPYLQRLIEEGRAVTEGQRRGMKYRRVDG